MAVIPFTVERKLCFKGDALRVSREMVELTQGEFARRAGWSQQRQCKLEKDGVHCVQEEVFETIQQVFAETHNRRLLDTPE